MSNPILFLLNGIAVTGEYLLGQHGWTAGQILRAAYLNCAMPTAGKLTLGLEVNGVLTGEQFVVEAISDDEQQSLALNRAVPAGGFVRWKIVSFTGAPQEAATRISINVTVWHG